MDVLGSIPAGVPKLPGRGHTVYLGGEGTAADHEIRIVYNEQTILPDGRLQVVGKHVYSTSRTPASPGPGP